MGRKKREPGRDWFRKGNTVEKDYELFRTLVGDFVEDQLASERYEWLREFKRDLDYLRTPQEFYADYSDADERVAYLDQQVNRINSITLEEDHQRFRSAIGRPPIVTRVEQERSLKITPEQKAIVSSKDFAVHYQSHYQRKRMIESIEAGNKFYSGIFKKKVWNEEPSLEWKDQWSERIERGSDSPRKGHDF